MSYVRRYPVFIFVGLPLTIGVAVVTPDSGMGVLVTGIAGMVIGYITTMIDITRVKR